MNSPCWFVKTVISRQRLAPIHGHVLILIESIRVFHKAVVSSEFVYAFGHFHIERAVFGDVHDAAFLPPFDGVGSDGNFAGVERH
jgi:hypothetical protein